MTVPYYRSSGGESMVAELNLCVQCRVSRRSSRPKPTSAGINVNEMY